MKEYNIEAMWKEDVAPESHFSLGFLPSAIRSKLGVFRELKRIRNLFWWEWLGEFIAIVLGVFLIIKDPEEITVTQVVFSLIYSGVIYYLWISYFVKFVKGINRVPALNVKEAIQSYYDTLCDYINRIYKLALVLFIISTLSSLIETLIRPEESIYLKLFSIVMMAIGMAFSYALLDGYFDYMYKDSKTEFEILLRDLEDE